MILLCWTIELRLPPLVIPFASDIPLLKYELFPDDNFAAMASWVTASPSIAVVTLEVTRGCADKVGL